MQFTDSVGFGRTLDAIIMMIFFQPYSCIIFATLCIKQSDYAVYKHECIVHLCYNVSLRVTMSCHVRNIAKLTKVDQWLSFLKIVFVFGSVQCLSKPRGSRQPQHKTKKAELTQNYLFDFRITDVDWVAVLGAI